MIEKRLKEIGIKITEISNYLKLSRPTIYKFIKLYDTGNTREINPEIVDLFDYMKSHKLIGRENVIYYILNNLYQNRNINEVTSLLNAVYNDNPSSVKISLIKEILTNNYTNNFLEYIMHMTKLENKIKKSEEEELELREIKEKILKWRKKNDKKNNI